jgi:hypothetical protein
MMDEKASAISKVIARSLAQRMKEPSNSSANRKALLEKLQRKLAKPSTDPEPKNSTDSRRQQAARWDIGFGKRAMSVLPNTKQ